MPIKVFIPIEENISGFQTSFTQILTAAFDEWAKAAANYLSLRMVSKAQDADIVCSWVNNPKDLKFKGAEQGETYRSYIDDKDGKHLLTHAAITLCIVDPMSGGVLSDKLVKTMCLHEIGHALGLKGHSPNHDDIMFYGSGEIFPLRTLSARDVATINRLYETYQTN